MEVVEKVITFLATCVFAVLFCSFFSWYKKESANEEASNEIITKAKAKRKKARDESDIDIVQEEIIQQEVLAPGYSIKKKRALGLAVIFGVLMVCGLVVICVIPTKKVEEGGRRQLVRSK